MLDTAIILQNPIGLEVPIMRIAMHNLIKQAIGKATALPFSVTMLTEIDIETEAEMIEWGKSQRLRN